MKKLFGLVALLALSFILPARATEIKIVNTAIKESTSSPDPAAVKAYLADNVMDIGLFDGSKGTSASYFIATDFTAGGIHYAVQYCSTVLDKNNRYGCFIFNDAKYRLVYSKFDSDGSLSFGYLFGVFESIANGEQYAICTCREAYKNSDLGVKVGDRINALTALYPDAKLFVCYNQRLTAEQSDFLNSYLVDSDAGLAMTCLGRATTGGFYAFDEQLPTQFSVTDWSPQGATYVGTLATVSFPNKYRVVFEDYDGTGLQTNLVDEGAGVTPPTPPERPGFVFIGWDHEDAEFANVTQNFTATAQYETAGNSHLVTYLDWKGELLSEVAVEDGELCDPPNVPERIDYIFDGWTKDGEPFDLETPVKEDLTLVTAYRLLPVMETATAEDFLRRIQAVYPTGAVIRLTADIDLENASFTASDFHGLLEGDGHSITGIRNDGCLFADLYGTVRNLTFDSIGTDAAVRGNRSILCSSAVGAKIENCVFMNCQIHSHNTGGGAGLVALTAKANGDVRTVISNVVAVNCQVVSGSDYDTMTFGGLVKSSVTADFIDCRFLTDVRDSYVIGGYAHNAGGIVGQVSGNSRFFRCYNEGAIEARVPGPNSTGAGGIVGGISGDAEFYSCTNIAAITSAQQAGGGGIAGRASKCDVAIYGCVNRGSVTAKFGGTATNPSGIGAGGIIAGNWGGSSTITIVDSVNFGDVDTTTNACPAGGIVASFDNQGLLLYMTNVFNYGDIVSRRYAGGIAGKIYKHGISLANLGNSGNVTSTELCAGGCIGYLANGSHHSSFNIRGFINCGVITGFTSSALLVGGYEDLSDFVDTHIRLYSGVLAGAVSVTAPDGTTGTLMGGKIGEYHSELIGHADENCHVLQQGLFDYYDDDGGVNLEAPMSAMTAGDLTAKSKATKWLNDYAVENALMPWVRGRNFPELELWGTPYNFGMMLLIR